jgi:hypothetical protein
MGIIEEPDSNLSFMKIYSNMNQFLKIWHVGIIIHTSLLPALSFAEGNLGSRSVFIA